MNRCNYCQQKTQPIISFGQMPIANRFISSVKDKEFYYPLSVSLCPSCYLVQLDTVPRPTQMFNSNYAYISSTSSAMSAHFKKQAQEILRYIGKRKKSFVVELGCNDGIMLKYIARAGIKHLGIEPAANVAALANKNGVQVKTIFFNKSQAQQILSNFGPADVICASNTMCSIKDLHSVISGFKQLLKDDGVVFFEDPYIYDIVGLNSFDQIYDEHIYYFSALAVSKLAAQHGLTLVDMQHQSFHGGSMRYYLKKPGHRVSPRVNKFLHKEKDLALNRLSGYAKFAQRTQKIAQELRQLLSRLAREKQLVVGYGATSKSTTLLNYCRIGPRQLAYITDNSPTKIGKFTPGAHIPIKPRADFLKDPPPYTLLLAWNHQREILNKEQSYIKKGGKFITYFPKVRVLAKI